MNQKVDKLLYAHILVLAAISLSVIFAADKTLALNQLIFWLIGWVLMFFIAHVYYLNLKKYALTFYAGSIITLAIVLIIGEPIRGSVRWIDFGIFRLQPSEIAKVATIVMLASFYAKRSARNFINLLVGFMLTVPIFVLIFIEPDFGSSVSILAIWMGISFISGMQKKYLFLLCLILLLASLVGYELLAAYQKDRILTFLNPDKDPLGSGYNIIQSKIAVGSGKLFGRGLGQGSQSQLNFLPESESDFIFASISEQLGFFTAATVIVIFGSLILRLIKVVKATNHFGILITSGTVTLFLYQIIVNVGMNMAALPVTGITLPLISYGGSSLISTLLLLGIVTSATKSQY